MSYSEPSYRHKILLGQSNNSVIILLAINLILFVSFVFLKAVWFSSNQKEMALALFNQDVLSIFVMPAYKTDLLHRPWTILTHMFSDDKFMRVFPNMFWLWSYGYILQELTGNKKVIPLYVYGALGGALAFLLAYNFIPSLSGYLLVATLGGASASVMAIVVATTMLSPDYRLFPMIKGGIPLWVLTFIYIVSVLAAAGLKDTGTLITHLGGALAGILFIFLLKSGTDMGKWMNDFFDWVNNLFNPDKPKKGSNIKEELFYKSSTPPYKKTMNLTEKRVDEILDKINEKGYDSLSQEEKDLLGRAGDI